MPRLLRHTAPVLLLVLAVVLPQLGAAIPAHAAQLKLTGAGELQTAPAAGFRDTTGNVHESAIRWLVASGITKGCNPPANTRFCPDAPVTRAQMATFLTRALHLPRSTGRFVDSAGSVHADAISALAAAGVTQGCNPPANTRFCPDAPVTRAQMASFLTRALGLPRAAGRFTDSRDSVHAAAIASLAAAGVTKGCNAPANTRFCPTAPVTRAQMASFLSRALTSTPNAAPDPAVGVHVHAGWLTTRPADRRAVMDLLVAAGVRRIRVDFSWASIESGGRGTVDAYWDARVESVLSDATDRGLEVLAVVWQTPPWASPSGQVQGVPRDPADFGRFLTGFTQRHGDRIAAYEIWNEPNEDDFFLGSATQYVALLRAAAAAIRAGDPTAAVVLGAPTYNDTGWLEEVYEAGAQGAFDVMATHPYLAPSDMPPATESPDSIYLLTHVTAVLALMDQYGDDDLPVWFTEFGWHTAPTTKDAKPWERGVTPEQQAAYLMQTIELVATTYPRVTAVYWYNARDRDDSGPRNNSYGLVERDLTPKPVYRALKERLLSGR